MIALVTFTLVSLNPRVCSLTTMVNDPDSFAISEAVSLGSHDSKNPARLLIAVCLNNHFVAIKEE